jgi:chemotaxis signal transduction protein
VTRVLVCFDAGDASYAVPVEDTRGVERAEGLRPLPAPLPGVAGLLRPEEEALPVLDPFAADPNGHVLVLQPAAERFGLLVERVTGVVRVDDAAVGPPPAGQADALVGGVVRSPLARALLLDADVLSRRLRP